MALLIKNQKNIPAGLPVVSSWVHVPRGYQNIHNVGVATSTYPIYSVLNGRCLVRWMVAQVGTVMGATANNLSVTTTPASGTAVVIASTVASANREAGGFFVVEGDGTAVVASNAGCAFGMAFQPWLVNVGTIDQILSADNTGTLRWDLFYEPVDEGARIVATPLNTTLGA